MAKTRQSLLTLFLVVFALYLCALSPALDWFDSPELSQAAHFLDLTHPPGQPLFVLLGKALTFLPFGSIPFRVNLLSALTCAGAVTLTLALLPTLPQLWALLGLGVAVALHACVMLQAVRAEVYGLYLFVALAVIVLVHQSLLRTRGTKLNWREGFLLPCFLLGLGFGNHHFLLLLLTPYLFYVLWRAWPKAPLWGLFMLLAGLAVYLFLPVRTHALTPPLLGWGRPGSWTELVDFFRGRDFGVFFLWPWKNPLPMLQAIADVGWLVWAGGLIGAVWAGRGKGKYRDGALWIALGVAFAGFLVKVYYPENPDALGYIALVPLLLWYFIALALMQAPQPWRNVGVVAALLLAIFMARNSTHPLWRADNYLPQTYVDDLENNAPYGALVFLSSDHAIFPALFTQNIDGARPDIAYIAPGMAGASWYRRYLQRRYSDLQVPMTPGDSVTVLAAANPTRALFAEKFEELKRIARLQPAHYKIVPWAQWYTAHTPGAADIAPAARFEMAYAGAPQLNRMTGDQIHALIHGERATYYYDQGRIDAAVAEMEVATAWPHPTTVDACRQPTKLTLLAFPLLPSATKAFISRRADDLVRLGQHYLELCGGDRGTSRNGLEAAAAVFAEALQLGNPNGLVLLADQATRQKDFSTALRLLESIPEESDAKRAAVGIARGYADFGGKK